MSLSALKLMFIICCHSVANVTQISKPVAHCCPLILFTSCEHVALLAGKGLLGEINETESPQKPK